MKKILLPIFIISIFSLELPAVSVQSASIICSSQVRVYFDSAVDDTASVTGNYSFSPSLGDVVISSAFIRSADTNKSVELRLSSGIAHNVQYTITVAGITGLSGNVSATFVGVNFEGANPNPIFMDDFNRPPKNVPKNVGFTVGDNPQGVWTSTTVGASFLLQTTNTYVRNGAYSLLAQDDDTGLADQNCGAIYNDDYVRAQAAFPSSFYVRFYFYLTQYVIDNINAGWYDEMFRISAGGPTKVGHALSYSKTGTKKGFVLKLDNVDQVWYFTETEGWYCFELEIPPCSGAHDVNWYVNGVATNPVTGYDFSGYSGDWAQVQLGQKVLGDVKIMKSRYYLDDFVAHYNYIGTIPDFLITRKKSLTFSGILE